MVALAILISEITGANEHLSSGAAMSWEVSLGARRTGAALGTCANDPVSMSAVGSALPVEVGQSWNVGMADYITSSDADLGGRGAYVQKLSDRSWLILVAVLVEIVGFMVVCREYCRLLKPILQQQTSGYMKQTQTDLAAMMERVRVLEDLQSSAACSDAAAQRMQHAVTAACSESTETQQVRLSSKESIPNSYEFARATTCPGRTDLVEEMPSTKKDGFVVNRVPGLFPGRLQPRFRPTVGCRIRIKSSGQLGLIVDDSRKGRLPYSVRLDEGVVESFGDLAVEPEKDFMKAFSQTFS